MRAPNFRVPPPALVAAAALIALAPSPAASAARTPGQTFAFDSSAVLPPFVLRLVVGTPPCAQCPPVVCPGVPVEVGIEGDLPSGCFAFRGATVTPPEAGVMVESIRLSAVQTDCDSVCPRLSEMWSAHVSLPATSPGAHAFLLEFALRTCPDTDTVSVVYRKTIVYTVADTCPGVSPPPVPCASGFLVAPDTSACAAHVVPGGQTVVPLLEHTLVPLAGLQGRLEVAPPLRVVDLQPGADVPGMLLQWQPHERGADWVLFSASGHPAIAPGAHEVLRVTFTADSALTLAVPARVTPVVTVAADSAGGDVPLCFDLRGVAVLPGFVVCVDLPGQGCDANGDGVVNVRDLVVMARCLFHGFSGADSVRVCHDCDHDSTFGIGDLVCCADQVLDQPGHRDSSGVQDADVHVSFGAPQATAGGGVHLPVEVSGADGLGGVLLHVRFPADRWRLAAVAPPTRVSAGDVWLPLAGGAGAGEATLAAIRIGAGGGAPPLALDLVPVAGGSPGGVATLASGEFSDPSGNALQVPALAASAPLPGATLPSRVALSAARPNPFAGSTSFSVGLPQDANVDLAVLDVAGRRVATLDHGRLTAGVHDYAWDGSGARAGVYFVRLVVDGRAYSTRVALLRNGR